MYESVVGVTDFDRRLLEITSLNWKAAVDIAKQRFAAGEIDGICLRGSGWNSLTFLAELSFVKRAHFLVGNVFNVEEIVTLHSLEELRIQVDLPCALDFGNFPKLSTLIARWDRRQRGLESLQSLKRLRLWSANPESRDFSSLSVPAALEDLSITRSNFVSFNGIEKLGCLRVLDIAYVPKLESIDNLVSLSQSLERLILANANKIGDYSALGYLKELRHLCVEKCAPIASLKFVENLRRLEHFGFYGTSIVDKDLSTLLRLPNLRWVGGQQKSGYHPTLREVEKCIETKPSQG